MTGPQKLVQLLRQRGWHIALAESCTGGLATAQLVGVPHASQVLDVSFVTYAAESKTEYLGVDPEWIASCGVVSEAVAAQMAAGAAARAGAEAGIGITGYAGPEGGPSQPAGTVCFGFSIRGTISACTVFFDDGVRNIVRRKAAAFALRRMAELLEQTPAETAIT